MVPPERSRRESDPAADPFEAARDIPIPEVKYFNILTHDAWGDALGVTPGGTTYPVVLSCDYSKGKFYVLTIPNDPADLYVLPPAVLSVIRAAVGTPSRFASIMLRPRSLYSATTTMHLSCKTICPRRQK